MPMQPIDAREARSRIQFEFMELPLLKLTPAQIRRLCDLPHEACDAAISSLVSIGFLWRNGEGLVQRRGVAGAVIGSPSLGAAS
jgi:hypothetical protein